MKKGTGDLRPGENQVHVNTTFQTRKGSSLGREEEKELVTFFAWIRCKDGIFEMLIDSTSFPFLLNPSRSPWEPGGLRLLPQGREEQSKEEWGHFLYLHPKSLNSINTSSNKLQEKVKDREAYNAAVHEVTKGQTQLSDWTTKLSRDWEGGVKPTNLRLKNKAMLWAEVGDRMCAVYAARGDPLTWRDPAGENHGHLYGLHELPWNQLQTSCGHCPSCGPHQHCTHSLRPRVSAQPRRCSPRGNSLLQQPSNVRDTFSSGDERAEAGKGRSVRGHADRNHPPWPGAAVPSAWVILPREALGRNAELTSHHQQEESGRVERRRQFTCPTNLGDSSSLDSILAEWCARPQELSQNDWAETTRNSFHHLKTRDFVPGDGAALLISTWAPFPNKVSCQQVCLLAQC